MAIKKIQPPSTELMVQERTAGLKLVASLKPLISGLIVKSPEDYKKADTMLAQVMDKRKAWKLRMADILDPLKETVDAAKRAYKSADTLFDEIDGPMAELESNVKKRMRAFKLEERRLITEAAEARAKEEAKLAAELKAKEEAEAKSRTPAMANRLMEQRARLQQALAEKQLEQTPVATRVTGSQARVSKKFRVNDKVALIRHILGHQEEDLSSILAIDETELSAYFKMVEPNVGYWLPGVEVYEDINIAGKRS